MITLFISSHQNWRPQ